MALVLRLECDRVDCANAVEVPIGPDQTPGEVVAAEGWGLVRLGVQSDDGRYLVEIALGGNREIQELLSALAEYVTERGDGPARLELAGHRYTLPPQPGLNGLVGVGGEDEPEPQPEAAGTDG
jgi:hypothetical protein